ncbi:MAG: host-nuclease inhibitor Gam family protein [Christensenellales bacterium]
MNRRCASSRCCTGQTRQSQEPDAYVWQVGFRQSTRLTLPRGVEKVKTIIEELLRRGMKECVVYPEPKIDKDALKKYSAGEIAEVGAKLEVEDVFGYDVDEEALGQQ